MWKLAGLFFALILLVGGVAAAEMVQFDAYPMSGAAPLDVRFTDHSTIPNIKYWHWEFGDGSSAFTQNPTHTYTKAGTYDVILTVYVGGEEYHHKKMAYVQVGGTATPYPTAKISDQFSALWTGISTDAYWAGTQNDRYHRGKSSVGTVGMIPNESTVLVSFTGMAGRTAGASEWLQGCIAIDDEGTLYVCSDGAHFYAINADGTVKWVRDLTDNYYGYYGYGTPLLTNDGAVVMPLDGIVIALNTTDGSTRWIRQLPVGDSWACSSAGVGIGADGTIYVVENDDKIYALTTNGSVKWSHALDIPSYERVCTPVVAQNGYVIVGDWDGYLYALHPTDGHVVWSIQMKYLSPYGYYSDPYQMTTPVIALDGTIYVTHGNLAYGSQFPAWIQYRALWSIDPDDGSVNWVYAKGAYETGIYSSGEVDSSPLILSNGNIVMRMYPDKFACVSPSGDEVWFTDLYEEYGFDYGVITPSYYDLILDANDYIYGSCTYGSVYCLDSTDGSLEWIQDIGDGAWLTGLSIGKDGVLYVGASSGDWGDDPRIYAFAPEMEEEDVCVDDNCFDGAWDSPDLHTRYPLWANITTVQPQVIDTETVYFSGRLNWSGDPIPVWFEYGPASNSYGYCTVHTNVTGGEQIYGNSSFLTYNFTYRQRDYPLIAGQRYYIRAATEYGYGEEMRFCLNNTDAHPVPTYSNSSDLFIYSFRNGTTMASDLAEAVWSPYYLMMGAFFFGLVISAIFANMIMKQNSVIIPVIVALFCGSLIWSLFPPEFVQAAQAFYILAVAGIVYWIFTKRYR